MNYRIKDLPISERPRERLKNIGIDNLSDKELLAIILKAGTKERNVNILAIDILNKYSLSKFKNLTIKEKT